MFFGRLSVCLSLSRYTANWNARVSIKKKRLYILKLRNDNLTIFQPLVRHESENKTLVKLKRVFKPNWRIYKCIYLLCPFSERKKWGIFLVRVVIFSDAITLSRQQFNWALHRWPTYLVPYSSLLVFSLRLGDYDICSPAKSVFIYSLMISLELFSFEMNLKKFALSDLIYYVV